VEGGNISLETHNLFEKIAYDKGMNCGDQAVA
jgi:hypothetical protein